MNDDLTITKHIIIPWSEIEFRFSRSSGPGGQNVNKLSTKAELSFNVSSSQAFDEATRARLCAKLASHIDSTGTITITAQESRSQFQNKRIAVEKLIHLLKHGLFVAKPRTKTKPTRSSAKKRLESKTKRGNIKRSRIKRIDTE